MKQAGTTKKTENVAPAPPKKLYRLPKEGKVAGVCAGLADYLELDVTLVRLVFVVLTLASGGFGVLIYIVLAVVMPVGEGTQATAVDGKNIGENVQALAEEVKSNSGLNRLRNYTGVILVLLGVWLLLVQFFPGWTFLNWDVVWPAILVILGLALVLKGRK